MLKKKNSTKKKVNPKTLVAKSYADRVQNSLEKKGVQFFEPVSSLSVDSDYLSLPPDITDCTGRELGKYLNAFTQQKMYMRTLIGWSECMVEEAKRKYMSISAPKYQELSREKMTEKTKDIIVQNDEEVLPLYEEYRDICMKRDVLTYNLSSIEDAIFLISREISRREKDFQDENRNYNVSRK